MHLLCVVENSLPGRHVANIATDIARRMEARLSVVSADRLRQTDAASSPRHDLLVVGPPQPWSLRERLPWSARNRVIRRSRAPVMVVSDNSAVHRYDRIVLAYDLSEAGREAAAGAAHLASSLDATIHVVFPLARRRRRAYPRWQLERAASRDIRTAPADGHRLDIEFSRRVGRPAKELARAVAQLKPAVVVVGTGVRPAWRRWHPAVARDVLRRGRHPVVLVQA
jgi:nucleotide-binding universal stress UspA family protein